MYRGGSRKYFARQPLSRNDKCCLKIYNLDDSVSRNEMGHLYAHYLTDKTVSVLKYVIMSRDLMSQKRIVSRRDVSKCSVYKCTVSRQTVSTRQKLSRKNTCYIFPLVLSQFQRYPCIFLTVRKCDVRQREGRKIRCCSVGSTYTAIVIVTVLV
jgi:hypothetical protein